MCQPLSTSGLSTLYRFSRSNLLIFQSTSDSLAYCELYLTLAHLLRRFDLKLYDTTKEDMEWKDSFTPVRKGPLKVTLTRVEE